jgi:hypothetical protein
MSGQTTTRIWLASHRLTNIRICRSAAAVVWADE